MPKNTHEKEAHPIDPVAKRIGRAIRKVRKTMGLTQREFARRVGMGDKWKKLSSYETGRVRAPLKWLERIADATDYPVSYFLGITTPSLGEDERELLTAYRATQEPALRQATLETAVDNLKLDQHFRGERDG